MRSAVAASTIERGITAFALGPVLQGYGGGKIKWNHLEEERPHPLRGGAHQTGRGSSTKPSNARFLRGLI